MDEVCTVYVKIILNCFYIVFDNISRYITKRIRIFELRIIT